MARVLPDTFQQCLEDELKCGWRTSPPPRARSRDWARGQGGDHSERPGTRASPFTERGLLAYKAFRPTCRNSYHHSSRGPSLRPYVAAEESVFDFAARVVAQAMWGHVFS